MARWGSVSSAFGRWRARSSRFPLRHLGNRPRAVNEAAVRDLCRSTYLGDHEALVRVLGRYKMFVDTWDTDLCAHLLLDGFWEMWVTELLPSLVRPGMVCVDVGAHVGYFTLLLADLTGEAGRVHAFEPNPRLRRMLEASVRINGFAGRACIHGDPLSDVVGRPMELIIPDRQPGGAHLSDVQPLEPQRGVPTHTQRLDRIAGLDRVDFIKIDAETSEEAIWRGMRGLLDQRQAMTMLIEFTPVRYGDPAAFLQEMLDHGFALHCIDPDRGLCAASSADILGAPASVDQMLVLRR